MIDPKQVKLLKKIKRLKKFKVVVGRNSTPLPKELSENLTHLIEKKYLSYREQHDKETESYTSIIVYEITALGRAVLSERRRENRHWFIPTTISIFAAISAYREEIFLLIQAIMKLLK
ncbi:hypothetical protein [Kineothrix sp. MB12-C1]|uniref:hypothetical protein n=1 Tax=Kineothrix sp. MB12-C1 TaxID=3070215 RepID=UPI0027D1F718|nr:hypothetical protein [Kineothrix sp. MB12-C1]WMC91218.1 hypothetical protein RBB56_10010 [Kineothrix sp. MB12-C1]